MFFLYKFFLQEAAAEPESSATAADATKETAQKAEDENYGEDFEDGTTAASGYLILKLICLTVFLYRSCQSN